MKEFPRHAIAFLCCALGLAACGGRGEFDPGPTAEVKRERIERIVVATGTIEPEREVEVRPRIAGIIEKIHVHAGDEVEVGAPLVEIERELLASQVREAEAARNEARIIRRYAQLDLARANELQNTGVSSTQDLERASSLVERSRATIARADAHLDNLSTQLSYATVSSPQSGRVLDVYVEEGGAVSPVTSVTGGTVLLSLAGTEQLHLLGLVDENEIARVEVGQPARIRTEAYADRIFEAVVSEIAPVGQRVQNVTYFEVELEVTDADAQLLRPRMSGDAQIVTEVVDDAVIIPETALRYSDERIFVKALVDEGDPPIAEKEVTIGIVDETRVQVLSGLEPGELVQLQ